MKAKEYVKLYHDLVRENDGNEDIALAKLFYRFVIESEAIRAKRAATTDAGLAAVVIEQHKKWQAFCRELPELNIKPSGFIDYWESKVPGIKAMVNQVYGKNMF